MSKCIEIVSYFSQPTDLAEEMRGWPEFVSGKNYDVELKDPRSNEAVIVKYVGRPEGFDCVKVSSTAAGRLFDKALGRVIISLSLHSDNLMVSNRIAIDDE